MIAHDRHKLTLVNFSEYGRVSGSLIGSLSMESFDRSSQQSFREFGKCLKKLSMTKGNFKKVLR